MLILVLILLLLPVLINPKKYKPLIYTAAVILGIFDGFFKASGAKKDWDNKRK